MRAVVPPPCSPSITVSLMYRPLVLTEWFVTLALLPRAWTTLVQVESLVDTSMSKSTELYVVLSPPAPACRTVNDEIDVVEPRSALSHFVPALVDHLSSSPSDTLPFTAFSGP